MSNLPLAGKVVLITGANTGIGRTAATQLALQGAQVFLACRSLAKTQPVLDDIAQRSQGQAKAEFLELDLGDLDSVRRCADAFLQRQLPLHILINNAGLAGHKGLSASGFEMTCGVCHVGHFLLTHLLLDRLKTSAPARIVTVASRAHVRAKPFDFATLRQPTASGTGIPEYAAAKLANILFSAELGRHLQGTGVTTYSLHPGVVATDVWRHAPAVIGAVLKWFVLTPEQGAQTTLYCATASACAQETGLYYADSQVKTPSQQARDTALAQRLWQASEEWLALGHDPSTA